MNIVVFGLTISSSWGNGHATLWRGLCRALASLGCRITFFEHDQPYYAAQRDFHGSDDVELVVYPDWASVRDEAARRVSSADVSIVSSYCIDGAAASALPRPSRQVHALYDLDTPVTLAGLDAGQPLTCLGNEGLQAFDVVLSFTGGDAVEQLRHHGARRVAVLYGFADPDVYAPGPAVKRFEADLSFLGTYAADRQASLEELLIEPARRRPSQRFLIGGSQYPDTFPWQPSIFYVHHVPPYEHPAFFSSSRLTLNITRGVMRRLGWCPSGRLFEAASCAAAIVSDTFDGLEAFFEPGIEILPVACSEDVASALDLPDEVLRRIARAARERVRAQHTAAHRARALLAAIESCRNSPERPASADTAAARAHDARA